jgi:hypothetical protein
MVFMRGLPRYIKRVHSGAVVTTFTLLPPLVGVVARRIAPASGTPTTTGERKDL